MYYMERNINDVNREPFALGDRYGFTEPFRQRVVGDGFFSDLTKKLVSSAGEKAASAIGSKAGEALGNKLFNRQKKKSAKAAPSASPKGAPLKEGSAMRGESKSHKEVSKATPAVEENKGSELVKLLQLENKLRSADPQSNIHEIYNRLLSDE